MKDWKTILLEQIIRENLLEQSDDTAVDMGNESVKILQPHWIDIEGVGARKRMRVNRRIGENDRILDGFTVASKTELSDEQVIDFIEKNYERKPDWIVWVDDSRKIVNTYQRDVIVQWKQSSDQHKSYEKTIEQIIQLSNQLNNLLYNTKLPLLNGDRVTSLDDDIKWTILPEFYFTSVNSDQLGMLREVTEKWDARAPNKDGVGISIDTANKFIHAPIIGTIENGYYNLTSYISSKYPHDFSDTSNVYSKFTSNITTKSMYNDIQLKNNKQLKLTETALKEMKDYIKTIPGKIDKMNKDALNHFKTSNWVAFDIGTNTYYKLADNNNHIFYQVGSDWWQSTFENFWNYMFSIESFNDSKVTNEKTLKLLNSDDQKKLRTSRLQDNIKSNPIQFGESSYRMRYVNKLLVNIIKETQKQGFLDFNDPDIQKFSKEYNENASSYGIGCAQFLYVSGWINNKPEIDKADPIDSTVLDIILKQAEYYKVDTKLTESKLVYEQIKRDSTRKEQIKTDNETTDKYFNGLVKAGDDAVKKKDWKTAKTNYELALRIYSTDASVKKKLDAVNAKLKQPDPVPEPPKPKPDDNNKKRKPIISINGTPAAEACAKHILELPQFSREKWKSVIGKGHYTVGTTSQTSEHADGNAIDWHGQLGVGDPVMQQLADYLADNAKQLQVENVIYNMLIWNSPAGWHAYNKPRGGSPHYDHVHVDFKRKGKTPVKKTSIQQQNDTILQIIREIDYIFHKHPEKTFEKYKWKWYSWGDDEEGAARTARMKWKIWENKIKLLGKIQSPEDEYNIRLIKDIVLKTIDMIKNAAFIKEPWHLKVQKYKDNKWKEVDWFYKWDYM